MKKRLMMLAWLLMAVVGMQAQSLIGTWKTEVELEGIDKAAYSFIFTKDAYSMKGKFTMTVGEVATVDFSFLAPGSYTREGDKLNIKCNIDKAVIKLDKVVFLGEAAEEVEKNPELKEELTKQLKAGIEASRDEAVGEFPETQDFTIISLTDTKLTLKDSDDDETVFTKVGER